MKRLLMVLMVVSVVVAFAPATGGGEPWLKGPFMVLFVNVENGLVAAVYRANKIGVIIEEAEPAPANTPRITLSVSSITTQHGHGSPGYRYVHNPYTCNRYRVRIPGQ